MEELIARVRRAGASGEIVARFDSGYWSIATLGRLDVRYTMAVRTRTKGLASAIAAIDEKAWVAIAYSAGGEAQVAECVYNKRRLVVRRTRLTAPAQARLWPDWRHFGFLTDLTARRWTSTPSTAATRWSNSPSVTSRRVPGSSTSRRGTSRPTAPGCAVRCWLTNLIRWTTTIGRAGPVTELTVARTVRTQLIAMPARLVNRSGTPTLRAPAGWPWARQFGEILTRLRALQPAPG